MHNESKKQKFALGNVMSALLNMVTHHNERYTLTGFIKDLCSKMDGLLMPLTFAMPILVIS